MAKIKYDVSEAESRRSLQPGPYLAVIDQMTDRTPDKKNDIEVVLEVKAGEFKGNKIWTYLNLGEASQWKLREFTDAVGLKPKGVLDTDRLVRNKTEVGIIVTADSYNGEYRGRVNKFISPDDLEADDDSEDLDDEDLSDEDEDEVPAPKGKRGKAAAAKAVTGDDDDEEDDDDDEDEDEEDYASLTLKELRALIDERDIEATAAQRKSKPKLIELLEEDDGEADDDEDEDEDEPDEDDEGEDDDTDDDDDDEDDYSEWSIEELKEELESRGLRTAGKKPSLIARLEKDDTIDTKPF